MSSELGPAQPQLVLLPGNSLAYLDLEFNNFKNTNFQTVGAPTPRRLGSEKRILNDISIVFF